MVEDSRPEPEDFVVDVDPDEYGRVADILVLAFRQDPGFQVIAGSAGRRRENRMAAMVESTLEVHLAGGKPVRGIFREGKLLAVSLVERPGSALALTPSVAASLRLLMRTNPAVAWRSTRTYLKVMRRRPRQPHHYLSMIAVDPMTQGFGLGRTMLEDLHRACADHPTSTGVALDTSNPANVSFYERFGYRVRRALRVCKTDVWCLWREKDAN